MKKVNVIVRILLGIMMVIFGLNKFVGFMPMPPLPTDAQTFFDALNNSGYIMKVVGAVELITGVLFLLNKYTALAAVVLFPVMLNAFLFHLFLAPGAIAPALLAVAMTVFVMFANKDKYAGMLAG